MKGSEVIELIKELGVEKEVYIPFGGDDYKFYEVCSVTSKEIALDEDDSDQISIIIHYE